VAAGNLVTRERGNGDPTILNPTPHSPTLQRHLRACDRPASSSGCWSGCSLSLVSSSLSKRSALRVVGLSHDSFPTFAFGWRRHRGQEQGGRVDVVNSSSAWALSGISTSHKHRLATHRVDRNWPLSRAAESKRCTKIVLIWSLFCFNLVAGFETRESIC